MMNTVVADSTKLTAASVSASKEPLSPEAYAKFLKKDQPARWQRFHASADINVVVIDNNQQTCLRLREQLNPFYVTRVTTFNSPCEGIAEIRALQAAGKPCVLVLDLHMPEKTGLQVLKELGVECPPVVVNTASIMKPVLADLCIQWDRYRADLTSAMLDFVEAGRPSWAPVAPIFISLKNEVLTHGIKPLIDRIDSALHVAQEVPDPKSALSAFIEVYEPQLIPTELPAEVAHAILEDAVNLVVTIEDCLKSLDRYALKETSWWTEHGESLHAAINEVKSAAFNELYGDGNKKLVYQRVHDLLSDFEDLSCRGLDCYSSDWKANVFVTIWRDAFVAFSQRINDLSVTLKRHANDEIMIKDLLTTAATGKKFTYEWFSERDPKEIIFADSHQTLKYFIAQLFDCFEQSEAQCPHEVRSFVSASYVSEVERVQEDLATSKLLKKINAGAYLEILFVGQPLGSEKNAFAEIAPLLMEARKGKSQSGGTLGFEVVWADESDDGVSRTRFYIKLSEASYDLLELKSKIKMELEAPTLILDNLFLDTQKNLPVYCGLGQGKNITVVGFHPTQVDYSCECITRDTAALVYQVNSEFIFAFGAVHLEAANRIEAYLEHRLNQEPEGPLKDLQIWSRQIYRDAVRLNYRRTTGFEVEPDSNAVGPEGHIQAMAALKDLGIRPERLKVNKDVFFHRD